MNVVEKTGNYVKRALALVKGDKDEQIALYNQVKADAAIDKNLSNLRAKLVDDKLAVKDAEDALENVKYSPETKISSLDAYTNNIVSKKAALDNAKDAVDNTEASIKYFTDLKTEMFKD